MSDDKRLLADLRATFDLMRKWLDDRNEVSETVVRYCMAELEPRLMLRINERGEAERECAWRKDDDGVWHTGCGQAWVYTDSGTPKEHGALFCYHCGGTLRSTSDQNSTGKRTGAA